MIVYESVVKETMLNITMQKSELKRLELAAKDQNKLMTQYFSHFQTQLQTFLSKNSRGLSSLDLFVYLLIFNLFTTRLESLEKSDEMNTLKSKINNLIKENNSLSEQINYTNKQIESLQGVKNELNSQIYLLNDELNKTKTVDLKFKNIEQEKRMLMQENSGKIRLIFLNIFLVLVFKFKLI
jgi:hypothetical protein